MRWQESARFIRCQKVMLRIISFIFILGRDAGREDGYTLAAALEEWLELLGILQNN